MRQILSFAVCSLLLTVFAHTQPQESIADVFNDPALNFNLPADRAKAVQRIKAAEDLSRARAHAKAKAMGRPIRVERPDGGVSEIVGLDENGDFIIYETENVNAAISTAANLVHAAPYGLTGSGVTVGVWDAGAIRATHQEFATGSRVTIKDGTVTLNDHSNHVAGIVGAAGVVTNAKGMAPQATIYSYSSSNDVSEMTGIAATGSGQVGKVYLSNHSYGAGEGWSTASPPVWTGVGTDQNAYDPQFGQYNSSSRTWDDLAFKSPYFLPFKSAGNDNATNPSAGQSVVIGGTTVAYDPNIHPKGDGLYRNATTDYLNGYENIGNISSAKNGMTIGAAYDAVTSGLRDPSKGSITNFSSRGPTDDGRIKPDIVTNGDGLYSTISSSDTAYGTSSGTSMAAPNAMGSAALLVQQYANLFAGAAMRASTLKGLILHTATDRGNPGPDYHYGWGLMNTKEAADVIIDHHANPSKNRIVEEQVNTTVTTKIYSFNWDQSSPLRATLCWTDPAGPAQTTHDSRTPALVNNLNLKIIAPNGNEYFPFVMPFVGTWTVASMSLNATTGINNTDNVEQVLIQTPGQTGNWQAVVSYTGTLTNNLQNFSLVMSGVSSGIVPLAVTNITPNTGTVGSTVTADITGTKLSTDTSIRLRQAGRADIIGTSSQMLDFNTLRCQFNLNGVASGLWSLVATNPDAETFTLSDAFTVSGSLTSVWSENFDATITGWTTTAQQGSNSWSVVTTASQSSTKSYFAAGPATTSITHLTSPQINMPTSATNLSLEFWHRYNLAESRDCGKFYLSTDDGTTWFEVTSANSGVAFNQNGYNSTMASNGQTNPFAGEQAWSGTTNGAFVKTTVNFTDLARFTGTGKTLRLRWTIATNTQTSSEGWWIDSISLNSDSSTPNLPPAINVAASTNTAEFQVVGSTTYHVLRGIATNLSVSFTDDAGEDDLQYSWEATGPAPITYSLNDSNAAKNTTATFTVAGDYAITVTATDTGGLSAISTVNVRMLETSTFAVTPESTILSVGSSQQFTATLINQFGTPNAIQPSPINWSASGGGTINSGGLFNATTAGGPYLITATSGAYSDTAEASVNRLQAGIELQNLSRTYNGSPQVVTAVTSPAGLAYSVTYNGQSTAPTNGGSYDIVATITDPNYEGAASGTLVISYNVSYQGNGNTSGTVPADQTKLHDISLTLATNTGNLSKANFSFAGWNTAADGSGAVYPSGGTYTGNASLILYAQWAPGSDGTWIQTTAGPFNWGDSVNWSGGTIASGADRTASFTSNITASQTVNLDSARTIGNITFTDSTTASNDLTISGANTINLVRTSGTPVIDVTQLGRTLIIASQVSGSSGLQKNGGGILNLDGNNNYTGGTTVNGGTINANTAAAFGTGTITVAGSSTITPAYGGYPQFTNALQVNGGVTLTVGSGSQFYGTSYNGVVSGSGRILYGGGNNASTRHTLVLGNASNTFTGTLESAGGVANVAANSLADSTNPIILNGGSLILNTGTAAPLLFNSRPITLKAHGTLLNENTVATNTITVNSNLAFSGTGSRTLTLGGSNLGDNTFAGIIADNGASAVSLNKSGNGTWIVSGNNSFTGGVSLATNPGNGRLVLSGTNQFTGAITVIGFSGTGTLAFTSIADFGTASALGKGTTGSSIQLGTGDTSPGRLEYIGSGNSISNRTVQVGSTTAGQQAGGEIVNNGSGALTFRGTNFNTTITGITATRTLTLSGTNTGDNEINGIIQDNVAGTGRIAVTKSGVGKWTLSGFNTYSGITTITSGVLGVAVLANGGSNSSIGSSTNVATNLVFGAATATLRYIGSADVMTNRSFTLSSGVDGGATIESSGVGTLTIDNTLGLAYGTTNQTRILTLAGSNIGANTFGKNIANNGSGVTSIVKSGTGAWTLSGANTYTGTTTVSGGKLIINGTLSNVASALNVDNGAILGGTGTVGRNVTVAAGGKLEFNLSSLAASHDRLDISAGRSFTFSGASELTITSSGGASPGIYTLFTGGNNIIGAAPATINLPPGWAASVSICIAAS